MTFLGIGPGELFLILVIMLVAVGPERLPGFARQAGRMIVGLRNWIQRSPDAQMLLRAKDELEQELQAIRTDLTQEMESVRQEMEHVRQEMLEATREATTEAARQLDEAAAVAREATDAAAQRVSQSLAPPAQAPAPPPATAAEQTIAPPPAEQTIAPPPAAAADPDTPADSPAAPSLAEAAEPEADLDVPTDSPAAPSLAEAAEPEEAGQALAQADAEPLQEVAPPLNGQPVARSTRVGAPRAAPPADAESPAAAPDTPTRTEIDALNQQMAAIMAELRALQQQVQLLGVELRPAAEPEAPAVTAEREPEEVV